MSDDCLIININSEIYALAQKENYKREFEQYKVYQAKIDKYKKELDGYEKELEGYEKEMEAYRPFRETDPEMKKYFNQAYGDFNNTYEKYEEWEKYEKVWETYEEVFDAYKKASAPYEEYDHYEEYNPALADVFAAGMLLLGIMKPFRNPPDELHDLWLFDIIKGIGTSSSVHAKLRHTLSPSDMDIFQYTNLLILLSYTLCSEEDERMSMQELHEDMNMPNRMPDRLPHSLEPEPVVDC